MTPDIPIPVAPQSSPVPTGAAIPEGVVPLHPGEILAATVETPPAGAAPGVVRLDIGSQEILVQLRLELLPGEKVLAEVLPRPPDEQTLQIRILARSGEPGAKLDIPVPGALRLAPGEEIPTAFRLLLASAKGALAGELLPFTNRASAAVRFGVTELRFQLDPSAQPGEKVFVRPQDAGGALTLQVLAKGGPRAAAPPADGGTGLVIRGVAFRAAGVAAAPRDLGLVPGNILTGTLVRVISPPPAAQAGGLFHGKPEAPAPQASPQPGQSPPAASSRPGAPPEGAPPAPVSPGRTALIRFPTFEIEVPWPQEASTAFAPGDTVRLWVRGTAPRLDLQLLPPSHGEEGGTRLAGTRPDGVRWVPSGGAGERSFGPDLLSLAEGMAELQESAREEPTLAGEAGRFRAALERLVLREDALTPGRVREAFESVRREFETGRRTREEGEAPREAPLRESLQRFLAAAREIGRNDLANLGAGAGRALASMEFLHAANVLRHHADQGFFLQIPYVLGGERGTMGVVVRGDREGAGKGRQRENYSAVLLLELEGLGPLRVDAALVRNRASVGFTTPSESVGEFIGREFPKLREAIESQQIPVERVGWTQGKVTPEPALPVPPQPEGPQGGAPFIDLQV